ncbi:hypothetical protein [Metabacillus fastidiosus]|nr:hypothetical protein [Metabacillus fastidiosus]
MDKYIVNMFDVSIDHISRETNEWLKEHLHKCSPIIIYDKQEYGWFMPITLDDLDNSELEKIPQDLFYVLRFAQSNGCTWIMMDQAANRHSELPRFKWN